MISRTQGTSVTFAGTLLSALACTLGRSPETFRRHGQTLTLPMYKSNKKRFNLLYQQLPSVNPSLAPQQTSRRTMCEVALDAPADILLLFHQQQACTHGRKPIYIDYSYFLTMHSHISMVF